MRAIGGGGYPTQLDAWITFLGIYDMHECLLTYAFV